jgi:hypothetical protein
MPRRSIVVLLPLTIAFVAHAGPLGQTPPTPSQDQQKPVFRSGVNLVQVDVVAPDRANRPAADLSKDDFEIFAARAPSAPSR